MAEFHWRHGVWFGRGEDGAVIVRVPDGPGMERVFSIPASEWASIVAAVTADGDNAETYAAAERLHGGLVTA